MPLCQILVIFLTLEMLNMSLLRFLENAVPNMNKQDGMTPYQVNIDVTLKMEWRKVTHPGYLGSNPCSNSVLSPVNSEHGVPCLWGSLSLGLFLLH